MKITGNTQDVIQKFIYFFGIWEPHITAFVERRLRPGDVFIDVGANIGYYTLMTSPIVGSEGHVVSIEASPIIVEILKKHIAINNLQNVRVICAAASSERGKLIVHHAKNTNIGATSVIEDFDDCSLPSIEVDAAPLFELLTPDEIAKARLIKIDVEGAEWMVLQGLIPIIPKLREDAEILLEVAHEKLSQFGKSFHDVIETFAAFGFHPYLLRNEYNPFDCLQHRKISPPIRLQGNFEPKPLVDLVFSRLDQQSL